MKIIENINGTQKITSYGDKLYYRSSPSQSYTQVKRAFIKNGSGPFVQFYQYDDTPPVINVTSSAADTVDQAYTLTGTIIEEQSGIASVTINGYKATVIGNKFSMNFTLSGKDGMAGVNNFTIIAIDNAGNSAETHFAVKYVNEKNTPGRNWGQTTEINKTKYVAVNGTWYMYYRTGFAESDDSYTTASANIDSSIPLPKGLSNISVYSSSFGEMGINMGSGGQCTISVYDNTTGVTLGSASHKWDASDDGYGHQEHSGVNNCSLNLSISKTQATHDLSLIINGSASGTQYTYSSAGVGISMPTFTYY